MSSEARQSLLPETIVHRVGGAEIENLRLSPLDVGLIPPGISMLLGGSPHEASAAMRSALPRSRKWQVKAGTVATTTVESIRHVGFDLILDPTDRFPNHVRLIHPQGIAGFSDENLAVLALMFTVTRGC